MKIRLLGCYGGEFPGFRTTSFLINDSVLLDAGAAASSLTMEEQGKITDILITHSHLDHIKDIPFLADNLLGKIERPVNVISISEVISIIRESLLNNRIWPDFTLIPNVSDPVIRFRQIEADKDVKIDYLTVRAISVNHSVVCVGYLIRDDSGSILYTGDTGPTQRIWEVANQTKDLKAIFVETSFPDSMENIAEISRHMTPRRLKEELAKLLRDDIPVYVVHMKPQYIDEIKRELGEIGYPKLYIAEQGQVMVI